MVTGMPVDTKTCTKCGTEYPRTNEFFGNLTRSKDGLHPQCLPCKRAVSRESASRKRAENPEKARAYKRSNYAANREREQARVRKWREDNPEKLRESYRKSGRKQYEKNPDAAKARAAKWKAANREKANASNRKWNAANPDKLREYQHKRRARKACAVPQRWRKSECPETNCYWCGVDLSTVETHLEHLHPISLGGEAKPYNEAPACAACNLSKHDKHPLVWIASLFD